MIESIHECFQNAETQFGLGGVNMAVLKIVLTIIYVLVCIALTVVVLMQEGKSAGLTGAISGAAESYWGKNKGRSMEGALEKATTALAVSFILISILLCLNIW